jgi:hypothetical protein
MGTKTDPRAAFAALEDAELIRRAIEATPDDRPGYEGQPMPATEFAERVAFANPRTVRRYLAGDRELPRLLREKCIEILSAPKPKAKAKRAPRIRRARATA